MSTKADEESKKITLVEYGDDKFAVDYEGKESAQ